MKVKKVGMGGGEGEEGEGEGGDMEMEWEPELFEEERPIVNRPVVSPNCRANKASPDR